MEVHVVVPCLMRKQNYDNINQYKTIQNKSLSFPKTSHITTIQKSAQIILSSWSKLSGGEMCAKGEVIRQLINNQDTNLYVPRYTDGLKEQFVFI